MTASRTDADPSNDIAVANLSFGGEGGPVGSCTTTTDHLHRVICNSTAAGVTYVVAAGNNGRTFDNPSAPEDPAAYPGVLTVSAVADGDGLEGGVGGASDCEASEGDDSYASFSNFASEAQGADHLISAPAACGCRPGSAAATPACRAPA